MSTYRSNYHVRRMPTVRTTCPHARAPYKPEPSSIPLSFEVSPKEFDLTRSIAGICVIGFWRIVLVGGFGRDRIAELKIGEDLKRNFVVWMGKKRKSVATRLDEVDRTMYATFCSAANSLSQLYTQSMNQQKLSFQAGERHGLVRFSLSLSWFCALISSKFPLFFFFQFALFFKIIIRNCAFDCDSGWRLRFLFFFYK